MKILFVLSISLREKGPSHHILIDLIDNLLIDHEVYVMDRNCSDFSESKIPFLQNKKFHYKTVGKLESKEPSFIKRYLKEIIYAFYCKREFKNYKFVDAIFLQSCNNAIVQCHFIKKIIKKPIIFNVQDIFPENAVYASMINRKSLTYNILKKIQVNAYKNSTLVITISRDMKNELIAEGVNRDKIRVIHNWSYSDGLIEIPYNKNVMRTELMIDENKYNVIYAGNIGKMQNVNLIVDVASKLNKNEKIHFYLIGDGIKKIECAEIIDRKKLTNISIFPMQDSKYAEMIYSIADVNMIPLVKGGINTALPSKIATCLRCNSNIIACIDAESDFAKEINKCKACYAIDCNDIEKISSCIEKLSNHAIDSREKLAINLHDELFSKEKNINLYIELFNLLKENKV